LFKKSKGSEAKLNYMGHVLMESRNGLLMQTFLAEGGDENYDTRELVRTLRRMNITPHVAQNIRTAAVRSMRKSPSSGAAGNLGLMPEFFPRERGILIGDHSRSALSRLIH